MIEETAKRLREAEITRQAIAPLREELGDTSIDAAYEVQQANTQYRLAQGQRLVGRKIGLTAEAVQRQLGVDQPDFGMLFQDMDVPEGGEIDLGELIQPRIEAEIAFVLARDLDDPELSQQDVLSAIDHVLPCFEIVDSRIASWDIGIVDTIADNASSARFVVGKIPRRLADFDLINCGMVLRGEGEVLSTGMGAASLGNPAEAVRWLARKLSGTPQHLRAGDIVLSGALGPLVTVEQATHYEADIEGLGSVSVNFVGTLR